MVEMMSRIKESDFPLRLPFCSRVLPLFYLPTHYFLVVCVPMLADDDVHISRYAFRFWADVIPWLPLTFSIFSLHHLLGVSFTLIFSLLVSTL